MQEGDLGSAIVTKINDSGFILWSKTYQDFFHSQYSYTIHEDLAGNIFLFSNLSHPSSIYNMLCKINSNGNLLWAKLYDHGYIWGGSISTSDGGTLLRTGAIFIKTDKDGNVQWTAEGGAIGYYYYAPIEVEDGYIFTNIDGGTPYFLKINLSGKMLTSKTKTSSYSGFVSRLHKKHNGNLAAVFNSVINGKTYPTIVEMDKDLNLIYQGTINFPNENSAAVYDFCFDKKDEAILAGNINGAEIFFAKLDDLLKTTCDTNLANMEITPATSVEQFPVTNTLSHTLQEIDHNFNVTIIQDEVKTICTVPLTMDLGNDITFCKSTDVILRNNLFGVFDEYLWSNGATTPYIIVNSPGTYWLKATNNCEDSVLFDSVTLNVDSITPFDLGDDRYECENTQSILKALTCNDCMYTWNTGSHSDSIIVNEKGSYWLKVENRNTCFEIDSINIDFLKCDCSFYLPNAFTPNEDGKNDEFKPEYYCDVQDYELKIFDKWSKIIFSTNNINEGWDGSFPNESVQEGVYNYMLTYLPVLKGKTQKKITSYGRVTVIY